MEDSSFDPFNDEYTPEETLTALVRALRQPQGFSLYFALCNSSEKRTRLMAAVAEQLPGKMIQKISVAEEVPNLLYLLRETIADPTPDILFVYGIEFWLSGAVKPRSVPFLLNLNAARDSFSLVHSGPMVFWIPQYVLPAIADAAPDFVSVRSGLYSFTMTPEERRDTLSLIQQIGSMEMLGLTKEARSNHLVNMETLLAELDSSPENLNILDRATLLNQLGLGYSAEYRYTEAEAAFQEALKIYQRVLGEKHERLATVLSNIASLLQYTNRSDQAEQLYRSALQIRQEKFGLNHIDTALSLHNLADLLHNMGHYEESESLYRQALDIRRQKLGLHDPDTATSINNLAGVLQDLGRYEEAESLYLLALQILRQKLGADHPYVAVTLNNLAALLRTIGRYAEAQLLYREALQILGGEFGSDHPLVHTILGNITYLTKQRAESETV